MKLLLWIILIFALATGFTLAGKYDPGYVILVYPPLRVELSLTLFVLLLLALVVLISIFSRVANATLNLPAQASAFRQRRRLQAGQRALHQAIAADLASHYDTAEQAARQAIELEYQPRLAALIAARAASHHAPERQQHWLDLANKYPQNNSM